MRKSVLLAMILLCSCQNPTQSDSEFPLVFTRQSRVELIIHVRSGSSSMEYDSLDERLSAITRVRRTLPDTVVLLSESSCAFRYANPDSLSAQLNTLYASITYSRSFDSLFFHIPGMGQTVPIGFRGGVQSFSRGLQFVYAVTTDSYKANSVSTTAPVIDSAYYASRVKDHHDTVILGRIHMEYHRQD